MGSDISTTLIRLDHRLQLPSSSIIYLRWYQITRYGATSHNMRVSLVLTMKSIVLRVLPWESCPYNSPVMRRQRHVWRRRMERNLVQVLLRLGSSGWCRGRVMLDGEGKKLKVVLAELDDRRHKEREEKLRIQKENKVAVQAVPSPVPHAKPPGAPGSWRNHIAHNPPSKQSLPHRPPPNASLPSKPLPPLCRIKMILRTPVLPMHKDKVRTKGHLCQLGPASN